MQLYWTDEAERDRHAIYDFIAADNPTAAARLDQCFGISAAKLIDFPLIGRPGIIPGTRELKPHENYRLVYQIDGDMILILALVHVARLWPP